MKGAKRQFIGMMWENWVQKGLKFGLMWLVIITGFQSSMAYDLSEKSKDQKINLALRRTADRLLKQAGDSTSRIEAVSHSGQHSWQIRLSQSFNYDDLPALLQASLQDYGLDLPYEVTVKRCQDDGIDLGYHYLDFLSDKGVACTGRKMPEGCHYIEVTFLQPEKNAFDLTNKYTAFFLLIGGVIGLWFIRNSKEESSPKSEHLSEQIAFGQARLDVANQQLIIMDKAQKLTYRETKLLMLFVNNPDKLLERDFILQEVWGNEGVLVGRSVDVFVSRLRKKLAEDPSLAIEVVHGMGYRLKVI
jgi:hypothetical protein